MVLLNSTNPQLCRPQTCLGFVLRLKMMLKVVVIEKKCFRNDGIRHRAPMYSSVQSYQFKVNSRGFFGGKGRVSYRKCFPGGGELQLAGKLP